LGKARVELELVDGIKGRLKELASDAAALSKIYAQTHGGDQQSQVLKQQAQDLKTLTGHFGEAESSAKKLDRAVGGLGGTFKNAFGGVVGGAGLGSFGSLMTAGSIGAAVAAVGVIVGQSIRMAYEFEKASTRSAQALSIGMGGSLAQNIATFKAAAQAGGAYNIAAPEMARALATYGAASGAGVYGTAAAGRSIGLYSRAYGLDPTYLAGALGGITGMSQRSASGEAAGLFGAAETAGPMGRRITEFIGVATSTLATLQAQNPSRSFSGAEAAALVAGISRAGGYYGTAAGVNSVIGASAGLTSGIGSDLRRMSIAWNAGIRNPEDLILERTDPQKQGQMVQYIASKLSRGIGSPTFAGQMVGMLGPQQANTIVSLLEKMKHDNPHMSDEQIIASVYSTKSLGAGEAAKAAGKFGEYQGSTLGNYEKLFTDIQNKELQLGTTILHDLEKNAKALDEILNGKYLQGITDLIGSNDRLILALGATAIAGAVGKPIVGGLGRLFGGLLKKGAVGAAELALAFPELSIPLAVGGGLLAAPLITRALGINGPSAEDIKKLQSTPGYYERQSLAKQYHNWWGGDTDISRDLMDPKKTSAGLINAIAIERAHGYNLGFSVLNTGHGDDGPHGHRGGWAADVIGINGQDIDSQAGYNFLMDAIRNPLTRQLGLDAKWSKNAQIRRLWAASGRAAGDMFYDPGDGPHLHLGVWGDYQGMMAGSASGGTSVSHGTSHDNVQRAHADHHAAHAPSSGSTARGKKVVALDADTLLYMDIRVEKRPKANTQTRTARVPAGAYG
jgi:hypothetical protein